MEQTLSTKSLRRCTGLAGAQRSHTSPSPSACPASNASAALPAYCAAVTMPRLANSSHCSPFEAPSVTTSPPRSVDTRSVPVSTVPGPLRSASAAALGCSAACARSSLAAMRSASLPVSAVRAVCRHCTVCVAARVGRGVLLHLL